MKAKFTPGPWRFDSVDTPFELVNGECIGGEDTGIREVYQEDGTLPIATCYAIDGLNNTENARLIAAAPDLYEALENMVATMTSMGKTENSAIVKARAALAKASGEVTV